MLYMERLSPKALFFQLVVVFLLSYSFQGLSEGLGNPPTVLALVGEDVLLPCRLEPAAEAGPTPMIVEWGRPDLKPRFVHLWHEGQDFLANQNPTYEGRTSMSIDKLKQGDLSLMLFKVKLSDSGAYRCLVPKMAKESTVQLIVGSVSLPVIAEIDLSGDKDVLRCTSKGWYPEPEVLWMDAEGNPLSAGPTETNTGPDGLFVVSSRLTVEKLSDNSFTCRVQQSNINQTRETHIHLSANINMSSSAVQIIVILAASGICIGAVCFVLWKMQQLQTELNSSSKDGGYTEQLNQLLTETPNNKPDQVVDTLQEQRKIVDTLKEQNKNLESFIQELKNQEKSMEDKIAATERKLGAAKKIAEQDKEQGNFEMVKIVLWAKDQLQERKQGDSEFIAEAQLLQNNTEVLYVNLKTKLAPEERSTDLNQENQSAAGVQ